MSLCRCSMIVATYAALCSWSSCSAHLILCISYSLLFLFLSSFSLLFCPRKWNYSRVFIKQHYINTHWLCILWYSFWCACLMRAFCVSLHVLLSVKIFQASLTLPRMWPTSAAFLACISLNLHCIVHLIVLILWEYPIYTILYVSGIYFILCKGQPLISFCSHKYSNCNVVFIAAFS